MNVKGEINFINNINVLSNFDATITGDGIGIHNINAENISHGLINNDRLTSNIVKVDINSIDTNDLLYYNGDDWCNLKIDATTLEITTDNKLKVIGGGSGGGNTVIINSNETTSNLLPPSLVETVSSGLIAHYKFDGSATDMLLDSSGNNHHLTAASVTIVDGIFNDAADFDGSTSYLKTSAIDFATTNVYSISFWVKFDTAPSGANRWFWTQGSTGSSGKILSFWYHNYNNSLRFSHYGNGNDMDTSGYDMTTTLGTQWNFMVVTYDENNSRAAEIYLNGNKLTTNQTSMTNSFTGTGDFYIAKSFTPLGTIDGQMDDFRIYDRVLSAAEVEKLYLEGSDRGLIAHYKFDAIPSNGGTLTNYGSLGSSYDATIYVANNLLTRETGVITEYRYYWGVNSDANSDNYINIPGGLYTNLNTSSGFTISFWKLDTDTPSGEEIIDLVCENDNSNNETHITNVLFRFRLPHTSNTSSNDIFVDMSQAGSSSYSRTNTSYTHDNQYSNWTVIKEVSGSNMIIKIYRNNQLLTSETFTNITWTSVINPKIVVGKYGDNYRMDDLRIYDRVLSAAEVEKLYNAQYIQRGSISNSTDKYIAFKYNPATELRFVFRQDESPYSWQEAYDEAIANGGRMATKTELLAYLSGLGYTLTSPNNQTALYVGDQWVWVSASNAIGKDAIQVGDASNHYVGKSHYDSFNSTTFYGSRTNNYNSIYLEVYDYTEYNINFPQDTECDILIVGGGGGGGTVEVTNTSAVGAGGGGGGVIFLENQTVSAGTYTIKVGNGGEGDLHSDATRTTGQRGYNSSFSYLQTEAIGGGGGGTRFGGDGSSNTVGTSGGSGGGSTMTTSGSTNSGGTGTVGNILKADGTTILVSSYRQGYDGGSANWDSPYAGGGGGAGENGYGTTDTPDDGAGGIGRAAENGIDFKTHFNIPSGIGEHHTDGKVYFAGGGGAGYRSNDTNHNAGGLGGGGSSSSGASENGTPHTGGGGGGARNGGAGALQKGGAGGSGIVIIRYVTSVTITTQVVDPKLSSLSSLTPESNTLLYFDGIDSINYLELDATTLEITTDNKLSVLGGSGSSTGVDGIDSSSSTILEISKHVIPDTNATYDIGSAEKKIRHLYLSDTSLWIGDDNKISINDGKIKMRKRRKDIIPSKLYEVDPSINVTTVLNFINSTETTENQKQSINELNLSHWEKYMRLNHQETNLQASDLFANNDDYEQDPIIDAFIQRTNNNIVLNNNYNNIGIGVFDNAETTVEPSELLHIRKAGNPRIRISGTTDHNTAGVRFEELPGQGGEIIYDGNPNLIQINTVNGGTVNNAISITRDSRLVGIGTTSPSYKLDVNDKVRLENAVIGDIGHGTAYCGFIHSSISGNSKKYALLQSNGGDTYLNCATGRNINFRIENSTKMQLNSNGNLGIGTSSPNHPLHVVTGSGTYSAPLYAYHNAGSSWQNYNGGTWSTTGNLISIRANEGVIAQRMYIMSDERIKETITDIQDNEALVKFRQLQPKKYKYKDKLKYGDKEVYGFIAQEVSSILPNAVTLEKDYIPNVMLTAEVILYDDCSKLKMLENHNLNVNDIIRCKTSYYKDIDNIKILEVIDEKTIKVDYIFNTDELKFNDMDNIIIIYGKYVEDFNVLNKETIWTLTTSALQEIDRQMQQEKQKVITLENKVLTLENTITNLVSRIETLEQTNT